MNVSARPSFKWGAFRPNRYRMVGDAAYIELTGHDGVVSVEAIVDVADLPAVLARGRWHAETAGITMYAGHAHRGNGKIKRERLHRFLMQPPAGLVVDHLDGCGLNNRRENLRVVTQAENNRNRKYHREAAKAKEGKGTA